MMSTTATDCTVGLAAASLNATAKINLSLDVLGQRADGFHDLVSVAMGVDLCDHIRCSVRSSPSVEIDSSDPALSNSDNLVVKAAYRLASEIDRSPALRIVLDKAIPIGGGLGGGSSDAAAVLRLCNHLWRGGLDDARLAEIGSELGSDVPLFFRLPAVLVRGRGERVRRLPLSWSGWVLLVNAGVAVSTAEVYEAFDQQECSTEPGWTPEEFAAATKADELMAHGRNQLEPAVFRVCPLVECVRNDLRRFGLGTMRVSGAGSTLYRLFDREEDAKGVAEEITRQGIGTWAKVVAAPVGQQPIVIEES